MEWIKTNCQWQEVKDSDGLSLINEDEVIVDR